VLGQATGIQYLRRFYLSNSPMTYDPRTISRSTMFMANKIETHSLTAEEYAARLVNTTADTILASEYLILQSLRFDLEIKHPFRGLKGGNLELMAMARGNASPIASCDQTPAEMQRTMLTLPFTPSSPATYLTVLQLEKRITEAYIFAAHVFKTTALLTDAYFRYTPPQIWLSAHLLVDEPLTLFYLSTKFTATSSIYTKTVTTLRSCFSLFVSHWSFISKNMSKEEKEARNTKKTEEFRVLLKRNKRCMIHDKTKLVELNQARKRDLLQADGELKGSKAKKRKSRREELRKESDDFWGPELPKNGASVVE
jgi:cyclin H